MKNQSQGDAYPGQSSFNEQAKPLKVLSRSSRLAKIQVKELMDRLDPLPYHEVEIDTYGDKNKNLSLLQNPHSDIFTREIDKALHFESYAVAIHSAKDLPYPLPKDIELVALTQPADQTDALVSKENASLHQLPLNAEIGTSSSLRKKQILKLRPDLIVKSIRGNIEERIGYVESGELDAVVLATCALQRLGLDQYIAERLPIDTHPLQGKLAVTTHKANKQIMQEIFAPLDMRNHFGTVSLVGFGPGDSELLTLKGEKRMKEADVIYYDDLIDPSFLTQFSADKIYIGKRKGKHSHSQKEINQKLYQSVIKGNRVVRLKGGDTAIFSRAGEEIAYLEERFVPVEIIPGVTAASLAASLNKTPLTLRDVSSSLAFSTGFPLNKADYPDTDTLIYYMGASTIKQISAQLIDKGRPADTPALTAYNVGKPEQQLQLTTLQELANEETEYQTPLLTIIGNVVDKSHLPYDLNGRKILFTGTQPERYRHLGNITHIPFIEIKPPADYLWIDAAIHDLDSYDWLIFTSKHAVFYFFERLKAIRKDFRCMGHIKIGSIGGSTTEQLEAYHFLPDIQPSGDESAKGLLEALDITESDPQTFLLPCSNIALETLAKGLQNRGHKADSISVYRNTVPKIEKTIDLEDYDTVIFTSPSGVKNFMAHFDHALPDHLNILARGSTTQKSLEQFNIQAEIIHHETI